MPAYLCHGFRWSRRNIRVYVVVQNLDDAAPEWVIKQGSSKAILQSFYNLFDFLPPCAPPGSDKQQKRGAINHGYYSMYNGPADGTRVSDRRAIGGGIYSSPADSSEGGRRARSHSVRRRAGYNDPSEDSPDDDSRYGSSSTRPSTRDRGYTNREQKTPGPPRPLYQLMPPSTKPRSQSESRVSPKHGPNHQQNYSYNQTQNYTSRGYNPHTDRTGATSAASTASTTSTRTSAAGAGSGLAPPPPPGGRRRNNSSSNNYYGSNGGYNGDKNYLPPLVPPKPVSGLNDDILCNADWSALNLIEEYSPTELPNAVSQDYAYVADHVVRIDMSVSIMDEMARYEQKQRSGAGGGARAMSGPADETMGRARHNKKASEGGRSSSRSGWLELLRDELQRGEDIKWYVVVCDEEERLGGGGRKGAPNVGRVGGAYGNGFGFQQHEEVDLYDEAEEAEEGLDFEDEVEVGTYGSSTDYIPGGSTSTTATATTATTAWVEDPRFRVQDMDVEKRRKLLQMQLGKPADGPDVDEVTVWDGDDNLAEERVKEAQLKKLQQQQQQQQDREVEREAERQRENELERIALQKKVQQQQLSQEEYQEQKYLQQKRDRQIRDHQRDQALRRAEQAKAMAPKKVGDGDDKGPAVPEKDWPPVPPEPVRHPHPFDGKVLTGKKSVDLGSRPKTPSRGLRRLFSRGRLVGPAPGDDYSG